ncbi:unnamed protein product [Ectocarpus sp. 6 AP-2014]
MCPDISELQNQASREQRGYREREGATDKRGPTPSAQAMASQSREGAPGGGGGGGAVGGAAGLSDVDIAGAVDLEDPQGPGDNSNNGGSSYAATAAGGDLSTAASAGIGADAEAAGGGKSSPRGVRQRPPEGMMGNPMDGVGEDERPYNYICNLDKVNLGGPGWFNDVFKISVEVDSDRTWMDTLSLSLVPRNVFQRHCPLLDTSENITGTVTVTAPTSKRVWMSGITVTFEEHLMTVDSDTGELVGALEAQVATGQFINDKAVFSFNLDLGLLDGHRRWPVRETYVGDLMALRHRLMVSAQRPWYTFNVYSQLPLAMEYLSSAPDEDAGQENEEGGPNHVLVISDCNGRCDFDFGVDSFNLGDVLQGTVRFTDVTSPIVAAHVMLLRAEFMYGEASEVLVAEHTILGECRKEKDPLSAVGLSEEEQVRRQFMSPYVEQKDIHFVRSQGEECRMEAVLGDVDIVVDVPLHAFPLTPSHMSLTQDIAAVNDEAELVGVRYYIRLILEDSTQQAYWHTHEIFFHRSEPSPSSQGQGDDDVSSTSGGTGEYDVDDPEAGYRSNGSFNGQRQGNGGGDNESQPRRARQQEEEAAAKGNEAAAPAPAAAAAAAGATAGGAVAVESSMEEGNAVTAPSLPGDETSR